MNSVIAIRQIDIQKATSDFAHHLYRLWTMQSIEKTVSIHVRHFLREETNFIKYV